MRKKKKSFNIIYHIVDYLVGANTDTNQILEILILCFYFHTLMHVPIACNKLVYYESRTSP